MTTTTTTTARTTAAGNGTTGTTTGFVRPRVRERGGATDSWMRWLHPEQARLVHRRFDGPARLAGPVGTGKTVVALHRAARAAREPGAKVLLTSSAATLPQVLGGLLHRLAPEHAHRVEHVSVDAWARALLRERGVRLGRVERDATEVAFGRAWSLQGRTGILGEVPVLPSYWQDEIRHVIKGRGVTSFEDYALLQRVGRRTPLHRAQREAVWQLYGTYQALLRDRGINDPADVLLLAHAELGARPLDEPYTAVVVDEVQDLPLVAVRLLHRLVGDRPDGLLLVGDATQALSPAGFRLSEAGVTVDGRSVTLSTNHRNAAAVLEHAEDVAAAPVELDDALVGTGGGAPDVTTGHTGPPVRGGGTVVHVEASSSAELDRSLLDALLDAVRGGVAPADCAVLVRGSADVARWASLLLSSGLPVLGLTGYHGQHADAVKVGTVHRAKGLEFGHVVVVDADPSPERLADESDDAHDERVQARRRHVHVALTRARDTAWCGSVVAPGSHR